MIVSYTGEKKFKAEYRGHSVIIDQPRGEGGKNSGMTPPELLMASLGSCIGVYAIGFLKNTGLDPSGMTVRLAWEKKDEPSRIAKIEAELVIPNAKLGKRKVALLKIVEHCLVHNTLTGKPEIKIGVQENEA
ncbi:MAG: OsmC family protein [Candidatus Omnitrophota bacterium]